MSVFSRKIDDDDVKKIDCRLHVIFDYVLFFAVVFLSATENLPLISIIVEVASAFGTTGLSLGITDDLTTVGKLMIALLMFIGRIGMLYTLMIFLYQKKHVT
ncbi:hypothetical protein JG559_01850 [Enterococcus faecalis]|uniref:Uncharacterized protein n=1 Tax=Enterococcus faecalis TaxID=1351 RepID=A0A974NZA0_ENTFL|nr:hypothetical protein JG559_01850 [Enterococcus faecalis]